MQWDIADWAAQQFARTFYGALCAGPEAGEVDTALTRARAALYDDAPDSLAFATPVLLLRSEDGRLWKEAKDMTDEDKPAGTNQTQSGAGNIQFGANAKVDGDVFTGGKRVVNTGGGQFTKARSAPAAISWAATRPSPKMPAATSSAATRSPPAMA